MISGIDRIICVAAIVVVYVESALDPCSQGRQLNDLPKRSPLYTMDSAPLCDRYITEEWYRTKYYMMSTSPASLSFCGTLYPVWLKGKTPTKNITLQMTACEVGFGSDCNKHYTIDVKNCSDFLVYKLKPLDTCNAAYCFEVGDECVKELITDVRVSYYNITWKEVKNVKKEIIYDPYINLLCSFTPSADDTLLYHIDWYVDNDTVIQGQIVNKDSLQDAILSAEDMINANKTINSWIQCVVGATARRDTRPCLYEPSDLFFAGVEVLSQELTFKEI